MSDETFFTKTNDHCCDQLHFRLKMDFIGCKSWA